MAALYARLLLEASSYFIPRAKWSFATGGLSGFVGPTTWDYKCRPFHTVISAELLFFREMCLRTEETVVAAGTPLGTTRLP